MNWKHEFESHKDHANEEESQICRLVCRGGIAVCKVCFGTDGSLPTDCPGIPMTREQEEGVWMGPLDFRDGQWCSKLPIQNCE